MKKDLMQEVTDRIISQLEAGTAPWVKPWKGDAGFSSGVPVNHASGKAYRGINTLILWGLADSNRWMTYKQAKDAGGNVKKGEKGTNIAFFKPWKIKDKNDPEGKKEITIPVMRSYTVFSLEQCEGITAPAEEEMEPVEVRLENAEKYLSRAAVIHGGDRAFYSPSHDQITLPAQAAFKSVPDYYATALHELTHWTGHATRCDRDFRNRFGTEAYAREELTAEIGAAYLCAHLGIEGKLQHANYIESWLKVLKGDKKAIFNAAACAQKAMDFITGASAAQEVKEDEQIAA